MGNGGQEHDLLIKLDKNIISFTSISKQALVPPEAAEMFAVGSWPIHINHKCQSECAYTYFWTLECNYSLITSQGKGQTVCVWYDELNMKLDKKLDLFSSSSCPNSPMPLYWIVVYFDSSMYHGIMTVSEELYDYTNRLSLLTKETRFSDQWKWRSLSHTSQLIQRYGLIIQMFTT